MIRSFLSETGLPIRRPRVDAAAFVVFQAVRAAMLARLLEEPAGLDDAVLVDELTDLVLRYLVDEPPAPKARRGKR
jgi:Tetracyclin repressor-like, C-terminal domain